MGPKRRWFRAMLYPTWKLNSHWTISGAVQVHSRPYFEEEFGTQGYGVKQSASVEPQLCTLLEQ
jgi:hypothetical protein